MVRHRDDVLSPRAHASQYDLVNMTSQQIVDSATYARRVHQALP